MDPDVALSNIREAINKVTPGPGMPYSTGSSSVEFGPLTWRWTEGGPLGQLFESFNALDEWLSKGGFLPGAWSRKDRDSNPDEPEVEITVTRSAGDDRAVLILIDTTFEPDASDDGPGLRVLINDDEAYVGKRYDFGAAHEAQARAMNVRLSDIPYTEELR